MNKNLDKTSILLLILISISFVAFALLLILIVQVFFKEVNFENASYFGAFIGGLTSLAAIVLLYKTYQSQKNELQLAREIATKQEKTMRDQKIENSLFNMLSLLSETVKLMDGEIAAPSIIEGQGKGQLAGRAYLRKASEELTKTLKTYKETQDLKYDVERNILTKDVLTIDGVDTTSDEKATIVNFRTRVINTIEYNFEQVKVDLIDKCEKFYDEHQFSLSHYFRYVRSIIKFILESDLMYEERKKYLGILQAQLSDDELGLIFYYALGKKALENDGSSALLTWLDEYSFLENITKNSLGDGWHHWFYPKTQFKFLSKEEREEKLSFTKAEKI